MIPDKTKGVHFVGIGGIGMSGIARILLQMGHKVSGSDLEMSELTKKIESRGGTVFLGHSHKNIPADTGTVVYSSSISKTNPEILEAKRRNIPVMHRAEMLGEIFNSGKGIGVTGTHGKTTTTSLVSVMMKGCRLDPTVVIGGEVSQFEGNADLGKAGYIVAEADESDRSFLHLKPFCAIITNIEKEHLDHFSSLKDIKSAFKSFINNVKDGGIVIYNLDDPNSRSVLRGYKGKSVSFGLTKTADIYPADIKMDGFKTSYTCVFNGGTLGKVCLNIPGRHNVINSLAAILFGLEMGLDFKDIVRSLETFTGAKRRFELRAESCGVMLIEDYAHHPTEIRVVLDACRNWKSKRIIAVFQPHRYSRTKFLAEEFGRCFKGVDKLILTDIYPASEDPIPGVSVDIIHRLVKENGLEDVEVVKKEEIAGHVMRLKRSGDMIVVMGAGDIKKVAGELTEMLLVNSGPQVNVTDELRGVMKGRVKEGEALALHTSFRIGGPASIWCEPYDVADLKRVLSFARSRKIPLSVIGNGSNILARDEGFDGILVYLGAPSFKKTVISGNSVKVGAGYSLPKLVQLSCNNGLGGMESLVGIPGTVGGAIFMNAGGWSNPIYSNIGNLVSSLKVMDLKGKVRTLGRESLKFGYRSSNINDCIILEATLKLEKGRKESLVSSCSNFLKMKRDKQVLDIPSAGCVFKNPPDSQFTCGQLVDMLGLKGKRMGGAEISDRHANFIVNKGGATCRDVLSLIGLIKTEVVKNYGTELELEINIL